MLINYFPIHDTYELEGLRKANLFERFFEANLLNKKELTEGERILSEFY